MISSILKKIKLAWSKHDFVLHSKLRLLFSNPTELGELFKNKTAKQRLISIANMYCHLMIDIVLITVLLRQFVNLFSINNVLVSEGVEKSKILLKMPDFLIGYTGEIIIAFSIGVIGVIVLGIALGIIFGILFCFFLRKERGFSLGFAIGNIYGNAIGIVFLTLSFFL